MQVTQPGGKICNLCKWCHLVAKFATNASGAIWWPNLELMQVAPSGGQFYKLYKKQEKWYGVASLTQVIDSIPWVRCASGNVYNGMATLCIVTNCWPLRIKHMGTLLIHLNHHLVNPVATFLGLSSVIHNDINSNKLCFILSVSHVCQIWMKSFFAESCASYFFEPICTSVKGGGIF